MKFVCLSDMHLSSENPESRLDDLVETQFEKVRFVLKLAKKEGAAILQSGDVSHTPRSWKLLPILIEMLKEYGVDFYFVRGQHDDYMYSEETKERTNLGILTKVGLVSPLDKDLPTTCQGVTLYGANFGQELGKVPCKGFVVGVIHTSISDSPLWPDHKFTPADKYLSANSDYDFILVGDIHRRFDIRSKDGRRLINTGPMLRREATEYNFKHKPSVFLLDTDNPEKSRWIEIPHKPANQVLSRDHIERKAEADTLLDEFVNMIKDVHPEMKGLGEGVSFVENLHRFNKENNIDQNVIDVIAKFIERSKEGL